MPETDFDTAHRDAADWSQEVGGRVYVYRRPGPAGSFGYFVSRLMDQRGAVMVAIYEDGKQVDA